MRRLRRAAVALGVCLAIPVALFVFVQTPPGKRMVLAAVERYVSGPGFERVVVEGLGGTVPFDIQIDRVVVYDADTAWLVVDDAALRWSPRRALRGDIYVHALTMQRAALLYLPKIPEEKDKPPWEIPQLPEFPSWLTIDTAAIDTLLVAEAALGEAGEFTFAGHFRPQQRSREISIALDLQRLDKPTTYARADVVLAGDALTIDVDASDSVFLPDLLGVQDAFAIRVAGSGPLTDWTGDARVALADDELLAAEATLRGRDPMQIAANGVVELHSAIVPEAVRARLGESGEFTVAAALSPDGRLAIESGHAQTTLAALDVSGFAELEGGDFDATVDFTHADVQQLAQGPTDAAPEPLAVHAAGGGRWRAQEWRVDGRVNESEVIDAAAQLALDLPDIGLTLNGDVRVPEFVLPEEFASLSEEAITVALDGGVNVDTSGIAFDRLALNTAWADVTARGRLAAQEERIEIAAGGTVHNARDLAALFDVDVAGSGTFTATIDGTASSTRFDARVVLADVARGEVRIASAEIDAEGTVGPWNGDVLSELLAQVSGNIGTIRYADESQPPIEFAAQIDRAPDGGYVLDGRAESDGNVSARVTATASTNFDAIEGSVDAEAESIAPYAAFADLPYDGRLVLDADATYSDTAGWRGEGTATLREPRGFPDVILAVVGDTMNVDTGFAFDEGELSLTDLIATTPHVRVAGRAAYGIDSGTISANLDGHANDIAFLADTLGQPARGEAKLQLTARGTLEDFTATLDVQAQDAGVGEIVVASIDGEIEAEGAVDDLRAVARVTASNRDETAEVRTALRYADAQVDVERLTVDNGANTVRAAGVWDFEAGLQALDLEAELPELERIGRVVSVDMSGEARVDMTLETGGATPVLQVQAEARRIQSEYASVALLTANGSVSDPFGSPRGRFELTARDAERENARIARLEAQAGFEHNVQFEAVLAGNVQESIPFDGALQGEWITDEQTLRLTNMEGRLEQYPIALAAPTQIAFADGIALGDTTLRFGDGKIDARATWNDPAVDIAGEWTGLPLAALQMLEWPIASGTVSGNVAVSGEAGALAGTLTLAVRDVQSRVMSESTQLAANLDASATLQPDRIESEARAYLTEGGEARIALAFGIANGDSLVPRLDEEAPWSGQLNANLDLAAVPRLWVTETHEMSGQFTADLSLVGAPSQPRVQGGARVADARYENHFTGTILANLRAEVVGDNQQLTLTQLQATDGAGGAIRGEGELSLAASRDYPFSADLRLTNARLVHRDDVTGRIEGELRARGTLDAASVEGDLTVTQADIVIRPQRGENIPELDVVYANAPAPQETEAEEATQAAFGMPEVALDIGVSIPGRAFIIAQDVNTEWTGDVHIGGTLASPAVTGTVNPVRGHISFVGRRFTLTRESAITFDTSDETIAYLDLMATTRRDNLEATLTMRGTLDQLDVDLTSNPALPQDEVLSRVLFGKDVSEISPLQAFQLARAAAMLSGSLQGIPFFSGPSRLPVVDTLDIESGEEGPVLSVGKYLADNVFVEFETGSADQSGRVRVELEVTPNISVETSVGTNSQAGLGLLWKYDY